MKAAREGYPPSSPPAVSAENPAFRSSKRSSATARKWPLHKGGGVVTFLRQTAVYRAGVRRSICTLSTGDRPDFGPNAGCLRDQMSRQKSRAGVGRLFPQSRCKPTTRWQGPALKLHGPPALRQMPWQHRQAADADPRPRDPQILRQALGVVARLAERNVVDPADRIGVGRVGISVFARPMSQVAGAGSMQGNRI